MSQYPEIIAHKLQIKSSQVAAVATLLQDGATVPFIARYRNPEMTSLTGFPIKPGMTFWPGTVKLNIVLGRKADAVGS